LTAGLFIWYPLSMTYILTLINTEYGISVSVYENMLGFAVKIKDLDSGNSIGPAVFSNMLDAVAYAKLNMLDAAAYAKLCAK
jgi:hypothetical protein